MVLTLVIKQYAVIKQNIFLFQTRASHYGLSTCGANDALALPIIRLLVKEELPELESPTKNKSVLLSGC